jgi:hypothetical protein
MGSSHDLLRFLTRLSKRPPASVFRAWMQYARAWHGARCSWLEVRRPGCGRDTLIDKLAPLPPPVRPVPGAPDSAPVPAVGGEGKENDDDDKKEEDPSGTTSIDLSIERGDEAADVRPPPHEREAAVSYRNSTASLSLLDRHGHSRCGVQSAPTLQRSTTNVTSGPSKPTWTKPVGNVRDLTPVPGLSRSVAKQLRHGVSLVFRPPAPARSTTPASPADHTVAPSGAADTTETSADTPPGTLPSQPTPNSPARGSSAAPGATSRPQQPAAAAGGGAPQCESRPTPPRFAVSRIISLLILEQLRRLLVAGVIAAVDPSFLASAGPVFEVSKPDGSLRLIHNLRFLNRLLRCPKLRLPGLRQLQQCVQRFRFFGKLDIADAYYHLHLSEATQRHLGILLPKGVNIDGATAFCFTRLPFGLCIAPFLFQRALRAFVNAWVASLPPELAGLDYRVLIFLDDIIIFGMTERETALLIASLADFLEHDANWRLRREKCLLEPASSGSWLGMTFDLEANDISPDPRAHRYLHGVLDSMHDLEDDTCLSPDTCQSLAGTMSWLGQPFAAARPVSSALSSAASSGFTLGTLREAMALVDRLLTVPSHVLLPMPASHLYQTVFTDASGYMMGFSWKGNNFSMPFDPLSYAFTGAEAIQPCCSGCGLARRSHSIAVTEFLAVIWLLCVWPLDVPLRVKVDNTNVLGALRKAHSSGCLLNVCSMFASIALGARQHRTLFSYVKSKENHADLPSRDECNAADVPPFLAYVARLVGVRLLPLTESQ